MRRALIIMLLLGIFGCGTDASQGTIDKVQEVNDSLNSAITVDSAQKQLIQNPDANPQNWVQQVWLCDTVTPKGNFIKHLTDTVGNIFVVWGTTKGAIDTMANEFAWNTNNCLTITGENDQYIALTSYGKGLPHLWLLPRNDHDTAVFYKGVVSFDMKNNLLLSEVEDDFLLQNFVSHQSKSCSLKGIERITYEIPLFDEIVFDRNQVIIEWTDTEGKTYTTHLKL